MKKIVSLFVLILFVSASHGQRYLTAIFNTADSIPDIPYGSALNFKNVSQTLLLDFYEPKGDSLTRRPLIIYLHGGGFCDTGQTRKLLSIQVFCYYMALRGYAVASIDYRLDSTCFGPSFLSNRAIINAMHDAKASIRYFKANAGTFRIDTTKIFIGGESAGAITALTASYIDKMNEVLYPHTPPYSADNSVEGNSGNNGHTSHVKATLCFCGGTTVLGTYPVFDTAAINSQSDPPLFMVHGTNDSLIFINHSLDVAARANNLHLFNIFYPMYGASHCPWFYPLPNSWIYLDTLVNYTSAFLYSYILNPTDINESTINKEALYIYPNPMNSSATIFAEMKNCSVKIFDLTGSVVRNFSNISQFPFTIDKGNLTSGIYFLELCAEDRIERMKLVIN